MKYKVSFVIEGSMIGDDTKLTKENLKENIMLMDVKKGLDYWGNRDIDTIITNLKIERVFKSPPMPPPNIIIKEGEVYKGRV